MEQMDQYRIPVLEAFPWQEHVLTKNISAPPANVSKGDRYLLPNSIDLPSIWSEYENHIAWFDGFNWQYNFPMPGWVVYVVDEDVHYRFNGSDWIPNYIYAEVATFKELHVSAYAIDVGCGSKSRPYKRINDAIDYIIAAEDNMNHPYVIHIGPGSYKETIVLQDERLFNVYLKGSGVDVSIIDAYCGKSLSSTARNQCLHNLHISGLTFADPIEIIGKMHEGGIGKRLVINDCYIKEDSYLFLENLSFPTIMNTTINGDLGFSNIANGCLYNSVIINNDDKHFIIKTDPSDNTPLGWNGATQIFSSCAIRRNINWQLVNGGQAYLQVRMGGQLGIRENDFWIPERAIIETINSTLYGNWEINGDLILNGSFVDGAIIKNEGRLNIKAQPTSQIYDDSIIKSKYGEENEDWSLKNSLDAISTEMDDINNSIDEVSENIIYDQTLKDIILRPGKFII